MNVVKFFKYLRWILYLGLFIAAMLFTSEAVEKFYSGDTGITHNEMNIDLHHPTIIVCPGHGDDIYNYERDFNITYTMIAEDYLTYIDNLTLRIGENHLKMSNTKVYLREIYTYWSGACYGIRVTSETKTDKKYIRLMVLKNKKPIRGIKFHIASKEGSYGASWGSFKDGKVISFDLLYGKYKYIELSSQKYISLKCSPYSFYQQVGYKIMESDFSNCSSTCVPVTFPNVEYPLCSYEEFDEWYKNNCTDRYSGTDCDCNSNIIKHIIQKEENNDRPSFCNITQYKVHHESNGSPFRNKSNIILEYKFATLKTEVYKEYLIYDVIGMVGMVGGTLGLFIGFSFSNVITCMIEYIQLLALKIRLRKSKVITDIDPESQNVKLGKEWEQKFARMEAEFNQLREEKFKMADFGRDSMINVQKCVSK